MKFESSSSRKKSTFGFQPRFPSLLLASTLLSGALCGWLAWRVLLSSRSLGAGETAAVFAVFGLITAVWLWTVLSLQKSRKIILANDAVREKAKAARFEAEQYRNLFNYANDAILIFEPETETILETNDKACEIYGRRREDFVGRSLKEMSQNVGQGSEELKKLLHDGAYDEFESIHLRADGHAMNLVINAAVIEYQGKMAILTINRDVTAAKRAEAAVRESERNYRLLAEGIKHQVWTSLPDGKLDYVNERTLNYFGRTMKEAINDGWLDVVHPDDLPGCVEHWTRALETGEDYEVEFRLKAADGAYRWHAGRANRRTRRRRANRQMVRHEHRHSRTKTQRRITEKFRAAAIGV
jgi:PAS domain S-box-containing protein